MLRKAVEAHEQLDSFETAEAEVAIETRRPADGIPRPRAAQFIEQIACNGEDFGFDAGAVELSGPGWPRLRSGTRGMVREQDSVRG